jgi:hypothetical protein
MCGKYDGLTRVLRERAANQRESEEATEQKGKRKIHVDIRLENGDGGHQFICDIC